MSEEEPYECPESGNPDVGRVLVQMEGICKAFPGVKALDDVRMTLHSGEVLGLLGENGAGKSTLMNVLGGVYSPDTGSVLIDGQSLRWGDIAESQRLGVAFVHQELALEPFLTVAENLFVGRELRGAFGMVSQARMEREASAYLNMVGLHVPPTTPVHSLSTGQQQMIEIAKALALNAKILVLDEPTSSLSEKEVRALFSVVRELKAQGLGIVYISHKMSEIFELTDSVMVMRDGCYIDTVPTAETSEDDLVRMMVGRPLVNYYQRSRKEPGEDALVVSEYSCLPWNRPNSFTVRSGEVLGFYGLIGAGRSELFESILGLSPKTAGSIQLYGKQIKASSISNLMEEGLALVPENRKTQGLFLFHGVDFNSTICVLSRFIRKLRVNEDEEKEIAAELVEKLRVKTPSLQTPVGNLSGGNQQKVVLGKWLATNPRVLVLDEPTKGIDVGAKAEIYRIIDELAAEGMAIVVISSELNEVINVSDRLAVMKDGQITTVLDNSDFDQDKILKFAIGE